MTVDFLPGSPAEVLWQPPLEPFILNDQDIHVWTASLEQPDTVRQHLSMAMSQDEWQRANRFYREQDRRHFMVCRGLLRTILGHYANIPAARIEFRYGAQGKPELRLPQPVKSNLRFNLSHSGDVAVYAIAYDRDIGVDVELIRTNIDTDKLARRYFAPEENVLLFSFPPERQRTLFFQYWTSKEAYGKATGEGVAQALHQCLVGVTPDETPRLLDIDGNCQAAALWKLERLEPAVGYIGTLAVSGSPYQLHCWRWNL